LRSLPTSQKGPSLTKQGSTRSAKAFGTKNGLNGRSSGKLGFGRRSGKTTENTEGGKTPGWGNPSRGSFNVISEDDNPCDGGILATGPGGARSWKDRNHYQAEKKRGDGSGTGRRGGYWDRGICMGKPGRKRVGGKQVNKVRSRLEQRHVNTRCGGGGREGRRVAKNCPQEGPKRDKGCGHEKKRLPCFVGC